VTAHWSSAGKGLSGPPPDDKSFTTLASWWSRSRRLYLPAAMRRRRQERAGQYESPVYRDLQSRLAANLRRLRDAQDLTQEAAAAKCQLSTRLLQRLEGRDVNLTLTTLARLCEGLSVEPSYFFSAVDQDRTR
jgi:DNA-binding Xre family transcriptional regulator